MCGIAGIASLSGKELPVSAQIGAMCDTLRHRGPDGQGMEIRGKVAMGMRRLSVIDIDGGAQPIYNEDGTVRIVFNGEIYNFRELRQELEVLGHRFRTRSDTEVIVHAYEAYGNAFVNRLNGMFAFALHDLANERLLLVRDHVGIKPLFYAHAGDHLVWGSEIKTVLASRLVTRKLSVDALAEFLAWEYVPGGRTLFSGVKKLPAGKMIEVDLACGRMTETRYWDVSFAPDASGRSADDWAEELEHTLKEATVRQLVSDVPVGAFLSGGVDSSLMVAAMGAAKTFSIGFDDPSYNELEWSRKVADHLGVDHRQEVIRPDVRSLFDRLMHYMDDPIGDFSIFPTYLVSRHARKRVTVALSGDGGDELFGGYETYLADAWARRYAALPAGLRNRVVEPLVRSLRPQAQKKGLVNKARRFVEGMEHEASLSHARWRIFTGEAMREALFTPEALGRIKTPVGDHILRLFRKAEGLTPLNRSLYVDFRSYLVDNCLVKTDRMSMAVSLETRVPYLDREVVDLAFRIPDRFKIAGGKTKVLLKKVAARHLPRDCVYRPKEGFSIPIKNWLAGPLRPLMERLLSAKRIGADGVFRPETVTQLKAEHLAGRANHSHILWSLMVFEAWQERWLKEGVTQD